MASLNEVHQTGDSLTYLYKPIAFGQIGVRFSHDYSLFYLRSKTIGMYMF